MAGILIISNRTTLPLLERGKQSENRPSIVLFMVSVVEKAINPCDDG
jgi:hypothetical protein